GLDPSLRGQLLDLALGDHRRSVAEDPKHLEAAVLDHQLEGSREEEIADEHIIVKQSRGVNELHCGGELVMPRPRISKEVRRSECQHGTHALPAASNQ